MTAAACADSFAPSFLEGIVLTLTYLTYLKIPELLKLQKRQSDPPEHDEMLFIIIHQVYELWFKITLHELDKLAEVLKANQHSEATSTLRRVLTILKTLVGQIDVLETMTPVSFLSFRDRLEAGSGFQSVQFREFEFLCGNKQVKLLEFHTEGTESRKQLERRFSEPTLFDAFLRYLVANGYDVPTNALERDVTALPQEWPNLQPILIDIYHNNPTIREMCELLVDFDEGLQEWRYRHVKMVERTIGTKTGTGGSSGAEYLKATLFQPLFPDLWAIRSDL